MGRILQTGVGMIEVLVVLLVTTVGILGMIGLQTKSLQHNQVALLRSQAVLIGNDMMDRIRVNRALAAIDNDYQAGLNDFTSTDCDAANYPATCESSSCSASQMAEYDIRQWKFQMACLLPDSNGTIAIENNASGRVYVITIQFNETRDSNALRQVVLRSAL